MESENPKKTAGSVERKTMLYKTGVEYGDYSMNHVLGCAHGCKYPCYAFLMKKRFGITKYYKDWIEPQIVSNTLELLDQEIPRLRDKIKTVQLCFSTDPFMFGFPEVEKLSLAAIRKLNDAGIKCVVLTKGVLPDELANLSKENEYGITLVSTNEEFRTRYEPGAAPLEDRVAALKTLHDSGCKTWVSVEPFPTPNIFPQDLDELLETIGFVDRIVFGRMHYNAEVAAYTKYKQFFNDCAKKVATFCEDRGIDCYIKNGTITENDEGDKKNETGEVACR